MRLYHDATLSLHPSLPPPPPPPPPPIGTYEGAIKVVCATLHYTILHGLTLILYHRTRNRRSIENNYASFPQANIVVISNNTRELEIPSSSSSGEEGTLTLEIRFYVVLPSNAERAPYRETNYVVPRATLSEIVSQDGEVIEAFVRDSLSPPLTPKAVHHVDGWQVTGIAFSVLFSVIVVALILVGMRKLAIIIKQK
jgi:hypothetical protein